MDRRGPPIPLSRGPADQRSLSGGANRRGPPGQLKPPSLLGARRAASPPQAEHAEPCQRDRAAELVEPPRAAVVAGRPARDGQRDRHSRCGERRPVAEPGRAGQRTDRRERQGKPDPARRASTQSGALAACSGEAGASRITDARKAIHVAASSHPSLPSALAASVAACEGASSSGSVAAGVCQRVSRRRSSSARASSIGASSRSLLESIVTSSGRPAARIARAGRFVVGSKAFQPRWCRSRQAGTRASHSMARESRQRVPSPPATQFSATRRRRAAASPHTCSGRPARHRRLGRATGTAVSCRWARRSPGRPP